MNSAADPRAITDSAKAVEVKFSDSIRQKIFRAAIGEALDLPGILSASPLVAGITSSVLRLVCDLPGLSVEHSSVKSSYVLSELVGRGVDRATGLDIIDFLVRRGVFIVNADEITIPALDRQLESQVRIFTNRAQGWQKRSESRKPDAPAPAGSPRLPSATAASASALGAKPDDSSGAPHLASTGDLLGGSTPKANRVAKAVKKDPLVLCAPGEGGEGDPVVCRMPTDGGLDFAVHQSYITAFSSTYPRLDLLQQLRLASAWCVANPAKRKTPRGMPKFINSWLMNAQREAEIRGVVIRASNQGNGFGQGEAPVVPTDLIPAGSTSTTSAHDIGEIQTGGRVDDFSDLDLSFDAPEATDCVLGNEDDEFDSPATGLTLNDAVSQPPTPAPASAPLGRRLPFSIANARAGLTRRLSREPFAAARI